MKKVDLNVDIAEGFPHDADLLQFATSANICCGVHAGDPELTRETVELCLKKKIRIGAHPGYPDRESMGRDPMPVGKQREYLDSVLSQIRSFCYAYPADYIKPHGGFYNDTGQVLKTGWDSMDDHPTARSVYEAGGLALSAYPGTGVVIMALRLTKVALLGLPGTMHEALATRAKAIFLREGFADRRYSAMGGLVPRAEPRALLSDAAEIKAQVLRLAPSVDSICLHGDTPDALTFAELVRKTLTDAGYEVAY